MNRWYAAFVMAALLLCEKAQATSFAPYPEQIIGEANGRFYVVVKHKDQSDRAGFGEVILTIAEKHPGTPPIQPAEADWRTESRTPFIDSAIRVRDGDIVHGRIELNQPPRVILVLPSGKGIVTLDKYGFNRGEADSLIVWSLDGKSLYRKNRDELFDEKARAHFYHGGRLRLLASQFLA